MAINLVHRPDLDDRVEKLAARFGLKGRGRKTAIIEKALAALEERAERAYPDRAAVTAVLDRYIEAGPRLRQRLVGSGGTGRCSRRSLPDRWQPSPFQRRVGFRVVRYEPCSAFTRVVACVVAEPPEAALCHRSASDDVVTSTIRSDCYRLERQLPGGIRTR